MREGMTWPGCDSAIAEIRFVSEHVVTVGARGLRP